MIIDLDRIWNVSYRWNISFIEAYELIYDFEEQQNNINYYIKPESNNIIYEFISKFFYKIDIFI